jgi:hypothetical protein
VDKDSIIAILGSGVGLAGILLVFIGFIYSHAESFSNVNRKANYRIVAKIGVLPFMAAMASACFCVRWLETNGTSGYSLSVWLFWGTLFSTFLYGVISILFVL